MEGSRGDRFEVPVGDTIMRLSATRSRGTVEDPAEGRAAAPAPDTLVGIA